MTKIFTIIVGLLMGNIAFAQNQTMIDKLEAAKIGMITQKINLTAEQSKSFWITYTQYSEEKKKIRKELMQLSNTSSTASDEQIGKNMEKMMDLKEQETALDRKYYKEFQKSISVRQIFELYKAEIMFRNMLVEKLIKRSEKRGKKLENLGEDLD
jgi:hypothetical protein